MTVQFKLNSSNMKGNLVPDTSSSIMAGKVLADRGVTVLDIPPPHCFTHQVTLI